MKSPSPVIDAAQIMLAAGLRCFNPKVLRKRESRPACADMPLCAAKHVGGRGGDWQEKASPLKYLPTAPVETWFFVAMQTPKVARSPTPSGPWRASC